MMSRRAPGLALLLLASACGSKATLEIQPKDGHVAADATLPMSVVFKDKDGKVQDAGAVTWTSSDTEKVTLDGKGVATGHVVGTVQIEAHAQGVSGKTSLTVDATHGVGSVTLDGQGGELLLGDSRTLTLTVHSASGAVLTDLPVRWEARPNILAVDDGTTNVHATTSGDADLRAIVGGVPSASIHFSVPRLQITISPDSVRLAPRAKQTFTAEVKNGKDVTVVWSVLEGASGGTIDAQSGAYIAPCVSSAYYPQFHVVAKASADLSQSASAPIDIKATPSHFDPCFGASGRVKNPWQVDLNPTLVGMAIGLKESVLVGGSRTVTLDGGGREDDWLGYTFDSSGALDTTFGTGGEAKVAVVPSPNGAGKASVATVVGRQPSGTMVIAGRTGDAGFGAAGAYNQLALVNFDETGAPNQFFGQDTPGVATLQVGESCSPTVIDIPDDGQIMVVGSMYDEIGVGGSFIARVTADGQPDASFGSNGVTLAPLRSRPPDLTPLGRPEVTSLISQTDTGNLVVGGYLKVSGQDAQAVMTSFDTVGKLVTKFGTNGTVMTKFGNGDSTILAMGALQMGRFFAVGAGNARITVVQFEADGAPVSGQPFGGYPIDAALPIKMAPYPGGGWVIAAGTPGATDHVRLLKIDITGKPDGSFGNGGTLDDTDDTFASGILGVSATSSYLIRVLGPFTGPSGTGVLLGIVP